VKNNYGIPQGPTVQLSLKKKSTTPEYGSVEVRWMFCSNLTKVQL